MMVRFKTIMHRRRRVDMACLILLSLRAEGSTDCADYPSPAQLPNLIRRLYKLEHVDGEARDVALISWNEVMMTAEMTWMGDAIRAHLEPIFLAVLRESSEEDSNEEDSNREKNAVVENRRRLTKLLNAKAELVPEYKLRPWEDPAMYAEGIEREMIENTYSLAQHAPHDFARLFRRWLDGREPQVNFGKSARNYDRDQRAIIAMTCLGLDATRRIFAEASAAEARRYIDAVRKIPDVDPYEKEAVLVNLARLIRARNLEPKSPRQREPETGNSVQHAPEGDDDGPAQVTLSRDERARREMLEFVMAAGEQSVGREREFMALFMEL